MFAEELQFGICSERTGVGVGVRTVAGDGIGGLQIVKSSELY